MISDLNSEQVAADVPKYDLLLREIDESVTNVNSLLTKLKDDLTDGELVNHKDGLDILKIKVYKLLYENLYVKC